MASSQWPAAVVGIAYLTKFSTVSRLVIDLNCLRIAGIPGITISPLSNFACACTITFSLAIPVMVIGITRNSPQLATDHSPSSIPMVLVSMMIRSGLQASMADLIFCFISTNGQFTAVSRYRVFNCPWNCSRMAMTKWSWMRPTSMPMKVRPLFFDGMTNRVSGDSDCRVRVVSPKTRYTFSMLTP